MALQRGTPLSAGKVLIPPGRYWLDVFAGNASKWAEFVKAWPGVLQTETTQHFVANAGGPARDFLLFKVIAPLPWDAVTFGYPTIAPSTGPSAVKSSEDTVQRPPAEPAFLDTISDPLGSVQSGMVWAGVGLLAVAGLALALTRK